LELEMSTQSFIVALMVIACAAYAAWTLMPSGLRRSLATLILKLSLPEIVARPFRKALKPAGACGGCDSCGDAAAAPKGPATIKLHRRLPR
jgi:ferrous iron transport protein B